jgi:hypothetical protein
MRRTVLLAVAAGSVALTGCEALKEAFSPQSNVVAAVDKHKLETDRLVKLAGQVPGGSINADGVEFLGTVWVNLQLFAKARVEGRLKDDSATVARVMWPQILQTRIQAWQDTLAARRPKPTDASADSAYDAGTARVFQHIIVVPTGTTKNDTAAARTKIAGILAQVRRGGDFGKLAGGNADASKSDAGFLPVGPRGQFVKEFEDAAWALEPGKVSDVVQSPFGFHLIRRTPKDEARKRFAEYLQRSSSQRADSAYVFGLAKAHGLKVQPDAAKSIRDAAKDLEAAHKSTKKLVAFSDGGFTVGDFAHWMEALPQGAARQITAQPDSVLANFVEGLAQNTLVVRQIDSAKVPIPAASWQALQLSYRAMTDQTGASMGLNDPAVRDSTKPIAARLDSAAARVDAFIEQLVMGKAQFRPLPPPLVGYLRETGNFRFNRAGLTRAVELVTAKVKADSAKGGGAPPAGPMQRAPGGPPIPAPPAAQQKEQPKKP